MSENKNDNRWSDFGSICPQCGCLGSWVEEGERQWRCKCCGYVLRPSVKSDYAPLNEEAERQDDRDLPPVAEAALSEDDLFDFGEDDLNFELGND